MALWWLKIEAERARTSSSKVHGTLSGVTEASAVVETVNVLSLYGSNAVDVHAHSVVPKPDSSKRRLITLGIMRKRMAESTVGDQCALGASPQTNMPKNTTLPSGHRSVGLTMKRKAASRAKEYNI
jgi:hypothetical protein